MSYYNPTEIKIGDNEYAIRNRGDYNVVLDCFEALNDKELNDEYKTLTALVIFYEDLNGIEDVRTAFGGNTEAAIKGMFDFFNCGISVKDENSPNLRLFDWQKDEQLICSAINMAIGREIRSEPYVHWYTFMGYFNNIPKESTFAFVLTIRQKMCKGKKLEKYEKEFKRDNPRYFHWKDEEEPEEDILRRMWNNGGKL